MFFIYLILFSLIFFCFWLPYKSGEKSVGIGISIILLIIVFLSFFANFDFIGVFIWMSIAAFSIVFITYWLFRLFKKKKIANISAILLSLFFIFIALDPWISDWTFSKNDATEILKECGFILNDKIKLLSNESGGFRDYYHTFSIAISDNDYKQIKNKITASHNFKGKKLNDFYPNYSRYKINDTIAWESDNAYIYDMTSKELMDGEAYHCNIQLDKNKNELEYDCDDN